MIGLKAPSSPRAELERAQAIAIDWGEAEDRGRKQAGDVHKLVGLVREAVGSRISYRFIRKVLETSERWGNQGDIVDTTQRDEAEASSARGRISHWYLGDRVSPAVMVLEANAATLEPQDVLDTTRSRVRDVSDEIEKPSVTEILQLGMNPMAVEMLLFFRQQPTAALPRAGMSPAEIVRFMEEREITCRSPYFF
ncbi:MAG: hypothetical protein UR28_C0026G0004 [Candidatus Peregrinibacteria bacterium GW2011_GWF2_33_10]|nr:MAG: hypothetical protein UR28_C0026G0004 [Candidatus Peregrinibacteria bacterium GW2011_GWF2_33_10]OGJ45450.1 MAG: hypothetical protein A2272_06870 [Candidatus Peregrinibacteria bacterium RIFOXYA12_FULL_33_12]OGJ50065.1 MAG: hypothetical protein A2307_01535 [Candidatus Peregrinibacteria bacterium RIFOXYB2_FULL_33_20]